jgi:hypothetical protein
MPKKNRPRKVNFEGKQIPKSKLPKGSIFIPSEGKEKGAWYSSYDKLSPELKVKIPHDLFRKIKEHGGSACKIELDGMVIPIEVPTVDTHSVSDLLSEFKRIEKRERQFRGFSKYFWDHMEEQNIGNDEDKVQLYFQECAKRFDLPYTSFFPEFYNAIQSLRKKKALLGAALMKKTYSVDEEGIGDDLRIVLSLHPKPMQLPCAGIDGDWVPQNKYIQLCLGKKEAESEAEMLEKLRNDREENKGRMNWAEDLTLDDNGNYCRWGKDNAGRVLRKSGSNVSPEYFAYFKDYPNTRIADEDEDVSKNENESVYGLYGESRNRYEEIKKQKDSQFLCQ